MGESAGKMAKVIIALVLTGGAVAYAWQSSKKTSVGGQGNNGVTLTIPTPPEQMMNAMKVMRGEVEKDPSLAERDWSDPAEREEGQRQLMRRSSPEQRAAMREAMGEMRKQMKKTNNVMGREGIRYMMKGAERYMPGGMPNRPRRTSGDDK